MDKISSIAERLMISFIADDVEAEAGPKVGPPKPVDVVAKEVIARFPPKAVDFNSLKNVDGFWNLDVNEAEHRYGLRLKVNSMADMIFFMNMAAGRWEDEQNKSWFKKSVAKDLLSVARDLVSMEFPSQEALDRYLKQHPDANTSNHTIKKKEDEKPSNGKKHENAIRDHLSGTNRVTTKEDMFSVLKNNKGKQINEKEFNDVWKSLVKDGYLVGLRGGKFKWEM